MAKVHFMLYFSQTTVRGAEATHPAGPHLIKSIVGLHWTAALKNKYPTCIFYARATEPLTLIVQADRAVSMEKVVHLALLARAAGITNDWLATLPRPLASSPFRVTP